MGRSLDVHSKLQADSGAASLRPSTPRFGDYTALADLERGRHRPGDQRAWIAPGGVGITTPFNVILSMLLRRQTGYPLTGVVPNPRPLQRRGRSPTTIGVIGGLLSDYCGF